MSWLGLDVGGANLKAADGRGWAKSAAFALWRDPDGLASALEKLIAGAPAFDRIALTMTGELCDSFQTKAEGVRNILAAVQQVAAGRTVVVYLVDGRFASFEEAVERPHLAAASNWHVLARFAGRYALPGAALLIDVGSTTMDVIPLVDGNVAATGPNDTERLLNSELVYSGVGRTPVCAILNVVPFRDVECPVAAELFATTADVYLVLDDIEPDPAATWTADGRPLTRDCARQRLARMVCSDACELESSDIERIALAVKEAQLRQLTLALAIVKERLSGESASCILSGAGEFLAREAVGTCLVDSSVVSLNEELGPAISRSAPAHAVAVLAAEKWMASHN